MCLDCFSRRELDVIELLLEGLSNKAIGERLFISDKSAKFHITNILKKSKCESRSDFISKSLRGLLDPKLFPIFYRNKFDM
jgi:DNA-binding NarL/FixJ family response regulator